MSNRLTVLLPPCTLHTSVGNLKLAFNAATKKVGMALDNDPDTHAELFFENDGKLSVSYFDKDAQKPIRLVIGAGMRSQGFRYIHPHHYIEEHQAYLDDAITNFHVALQEIYLNGEYMDQETKKGIIATFLNLTREKRDLYYDSEEILNNLYEDNYAPVFRLLRPLGRVYSPLPPEK